MELDSGHYDHAVKMRMLILGRLASSAVSAAAALRIPDLLAERSLTAAELSLRTGTPPHPLRRLLTALVAFEVLDEQPDGAFALTPFGTTLRSDVPGSAWASARLAGGEVGRSWDGLLETLHTGRPAFDEIFGLDFFTYLGRDPELRSVFYASQASDIEVTLEQLKSSVSPTIPRSWTWAAATAPCWPIS
ncbi:methyltransferase dimerization domain-containing protein [Nonomuraea antimicrobica]